MFSYYPELKLGASLVSPSTKTPQLSPVWSQHETNKHQQRDEVCVWRDGGRGGVGGGFLHLMLNERKRMQVGDKRGEKE